MPQFAFSQDAAPKHDRFVMGISGGMSFPVGNDYNENGVRSTGATGSMQFAFNFNRHVGLSLSYRGISIPYDEREVNLQTWEVPVVDFTSIDNDGFHIFTIGPSLGLHDHAFSIAVQPKVGVVAPTEIYLNTSDQGLNITATATPDPALVYGAALLARFAVADFMSIGLSVDYNHTEYNVIGYLRASYNGSFVSSDLIDAKQKADLLNVDIGLFFNF